MLAVLACLAFLYPAGYATAEQLSEGFTFQLDLGRWSGSGLVLENLSVSVRDRPAGGRWQLRAGRVHLPQPIGEVRAVVLDCLDGQLAGDRIECREGRLSASGVHADFSEVPVTFVHEVGAATRLDLGPLPLAGGTVRLSAEWTGGRWSTAGRFTDLALDAPLWSDWLADWQPSGTMRGDWQLSGHADRPSAGRLRLELADGGFAGASGLQAAEGLALSAQVTLQPQGASVRSLRGSMDWSAGALYVDPLFVEVDGVAPRLEFSATLEDDFLPRDIRVTVQDPEHLMAVASLERWLADVPWSGQSWHVEELTAQLARAWPRYVRPFLLGSSLEDLSLSGTLEGTLVLDAAGPQTASAVIAGLAVEDPLERLDLEQVAARLDWSRDSVRQSRLRIESGRLYGLPIGPVVMPIESRGMQFRLAQRVRLPLLDGALRFDRFLLNWSDATAPRADLSLTVEPLSMRRFADELGLPPFEGLLAGNIPRLSLADGHLVLDGQLVAQLFDGVVLVDDFALRDLFGRHPEVTADVRVRGLDLQPLTEAFSFGRIEGRLDGRVSALRMQNWRPVAFDARFETPDDEPGRRRISQRAVDNLTELGGGMGGALGAGFLGFFEDFRYRRLGLGCRLEDGTCHMEGVAPAENGGYYIVEGAGLPRIDVIGFTRQVGWADLLSRLSAVRGSGAPSVEMP
ncbi:MAG: hypothetical protein ACLFQH_09350 [Halothiobacillaceae bacterium]